VTDERPGFLGIELQNKDQSNRAGLDSYAKQGTTADGFSTAGGRKGCHFFLILVFFLLIFFSLYIKISL
jgi:hypothetical protein